MLIINASIKTMTKNDIEHGFIEIIDRKISRIGKMSEINIADFTDEIIDAQNKIVTPGFVDAHTHLGLFEDSLGFEGEDGNEDTDPITPHLSPIDAINPMEKNFAETVNSGVTSVLVSPGSANCIGGSICAIKTHGRRIDDMIIDKVVAIKFALGENPKATYHSKNQMPITRMAIAAQIRETLTKAREYLENIEKAEQDEDLDKPEYDAKFEALIPLLKGEISGHFHAHRADDIFTAIRICKEFNIKCVIIHGTEAHLFCEELKNDDIKIISGPFLSDRSKPELAELTPKSPVILHESGIPVCISTDHPETPLKFFLTCGIEALKNGMSENDVLRAMTIQGAQIAGISHRVGSIEAGKDADILIFTGNPFDYKTELEYVIVDGKVIKGS